MNKYECVMAFNFGSANFCTCTLQLKSSRSQLFLFFFKGGSEAGIKLPLTILV